MSHRHYAYDNSEKNKSRKLITRMINEYVDKPVIMLEFLGDGTGLGYYYAHIQNLKKIRAIEKDTSAYLSWRRKQEYVNNDKVSVSNTSLETFCEFQLGEKINVLNLDFCSFYYDNNSPRSPLRTVEQVFASEILDDYALINFTFMVEGRNILLHRNKMKIEQDVDIIAELLVTKIEESMKYKVQEHLATFKYVSCGRGCKTVMANLIFTVEKAGTNA